MKAFAFISDLAPDEAVDVYLRQEDAVAALEAAIADVPEWKDVLRVEAIELDDVQPAFN